MLRLGKLPKKHSPKTLRMMRYIAELPVPPPAIDHASKLTNIGMMGNDKYGDCAVAATGHAVQSWTMYAGRGMQTISDAQILASYKILSPQDQGCYLLDVLKYWSKTGIGGDKVEGFVEVGVADLTHAKFAIQYFGSCYIGMALPDQNLYGPWTTPTGPANQNNGHCVLLVAYDDSREMFKVCTWGEVRDMSYDWYQKYCDEGYAVLNDISLIQASGKSPEGFDFAALKDDLNHLADPVTPVVVPPVPATNAFPVTVTATGGLKLTNKADISTVSKGKYSLTLAPS